MSFNTKGVILISVLMVVLILSSIAMVFGKNFLTSLKRSEYIEFQTISLNVLRNIETLALKKVDQELRFNSGVLSKNNFILTNDLVFKFNEAEVRGKIEDASRCFNINSLVNRNDNNFEASLNSIDAFVRFMELVEIESNMIDDMVDQIIDWIDTDINPRENGLEDYYYSGPLHNPQEYSSKRLFVSIDELKNIPAIRAINWNLIKDNFCTLPIMSKLKINVNTLQEDDYLLLAAILPNISLDEAKYIINTTPLSGFSNLDELKEFYMDIDLSEALGDIAFTSNIFNINTRIITANFSASSRTKLIYGNNKNGYIISRTYNGI